MQMSLYLLNSYHTIEMKQQELHQLSLHFWLDHNLWTWKWWLLLVLTVLPLIIWWKVLEKTKGFEIAFYGSMLSLSALILDVIGSEWDWWAYPVKLLPGIPPFITADSILVPVVFMIVYQHYSLTWKTFFISSFIMAMIVAFLCEPIMIWVGYYQLVKWKLVYSFLYYLLATCIARYLIVKIKRLSSKE